MYLFKSFLILLATALLACNNAPSEKSGGQQVPVAEGGSSNSKAIKTKNIVFFGNSLTAAYGLDPSDGYVALIQQRLDSLGLPYKAINAGLSGETTAGGRERIAWVLQKPLDIFVLELGGNDALRGIEPSASFENLDTIIQIVKTTYPGAKIILAGMEAPPNMGPEYTAQFHRMYPALAKKHNISLIPFFLENVGGIPELNQNDRIHPNKEGQKYLVENVWRVLKGVLQK
ncbi:MAG: arylesterase [Lewinellaceae bacterium]|nr:arylesterase [Saprospiraceae bacterium]MCB9340917.1 arylesterase [Lewinellaceae bacterium]